MLGTVALCAITVFLAPILIVMALVIVAMAWNVWTVIVALCCNARRGASSDKVSGT